MDLAMRKLRKGHLRVQRMLVPLKLGGGPPLLVNSYPKSGTHLLYQVARGLGAWRDFGTFFVHATSLRFVEIPEARVAKQILSARPSELCRGHLRAIPAVRAALAERGMLCAMILRDPRDVVVSEAHYLMSMNPWHRLSRYFRPLRGDVHAAIDLVIRGLPDGGPTGLYQNLRFRLKPFVAWQESRSVHLVRYEDMRADLVSTVVPFRDWLSANGVSLPADAVSRAIARVRPHRSHTFRSGRAGGWRTEMSPANSELFDEVAGDLAATLGYPSETD